VYHRWRERAAAPGRARPARAALILLACATATVGGCKAKETHRVLETSSVVSYDTSYTGPKYRTAIGKVQNRSTYMFGLFYDFSETKRLESQLEQMLKTHLAQSGRFDVVDRVNLKALAAEAQLSGTGQDLVGAQIVITGAVTEFGRKEIGTRALGGLLGKSRSQIAYAKVSITIVDVRTSRALHSIQGAGEYGLSNEEVLGFGSTAPFDATLTDKVLNLAVIDVVNKLVESTEAGEWTP
jgi:curli biogenesis system outer membrane secretion channel CsgG